MPIEFEIKVFEDRIVSGQWRVEYFDGDGGCYVAIFAGPAAEQRATDYRDALSARSLTPRHKSRRVLMPLRRFPPPWAVEERLLHREGSRRPAPRLFVL